MAQKKILSTDDVDDTPVNGVTTEPVSSNWAYDHSVDLDAHTLSLMEQPLIGQYLGAPVWGDLANQALAQYRLYAQLIWVPRDMTFDRIAAHVEVIDNGTDVRLGIYNQTTLYPTTLVTNGDCGTISLDATGTQEIALGTSISLTKGYYFLAAISDTNSVGNLTKINSQGCLHPLGTDLTQFEYYNQGYYINQAGAQFAALPDPFPDAATLLYAMPCVGIRVESLD